MPGTRLFNPSDSLSGRDPLSNVIDDGMIVNPPRFAEMGGLSSAGKISKNSMTIKKPAATIRKEPVNSNG
jgi:hypothetical protein